MYRKIFFVLSLLAIISLSSCRKNRTCNCVTTISGPSGTAESQKDVLVNDVNKEEAEEECARLSFEASYQGFSETVTCTLIN